MSKDVRGPSTEKSAADALMGRDRRTGQVWRVECGQTAQILEDVVAVRRHQHEAVSGQNSLRPSKHRKGEFHWSLGRPRRRPPLEHGLRETPGSYVGHDGVLHRQSLVREKIPIRPFEESGRLEGYLARRVLSGGQEAVLVGDDSAGAT